MRVPNLGSVSFTPADPGEINNFPELMRWLREREQRYAAAISALADGHLDQVHAEPLKPRDGDIRYADGTDWDPGSGKGIYYRNDATSSWVKLG